MFMDTMDRQQLRLPLKPLQRDSASYTQIKAENETIFTAINAKRILTIDE